MSKSRGNGIDPLDWIDTYGADATRFTLARGATPGRHRGQRGVGGQGARNFCNKLWNATRFALMNGATVDGPARAATLSAADRWILSRLTASRPRSTTYFERLRVRQGVRRALPLRLGRVLRLVPGAGEVLRCRR